MPSVALSIGAVIFGLGALLSLLSAIRTLQKSRSLSNFRLRRRFLAEARGALVLAILSGAVAVVLLVLVQPGRSTAFPIPLLPRALLSRAFATHTPIVGGSPTSRPTETQTATSAPVVLPPSVFPMTAEPTSTPSLPISVEAIIQGTQTPVFEVAVGRLRFSTTINGYQLIAPGESFANPIKQMYTVFTYQPADQGVAWTALWYQNSELKYVDTSSWTNSPRGIGVANWARQPVEWQAGEYAVQIFVGTAWKATGIFSLSGEPPTFTPEATVTNTPQPTLTATVAATPTDTATATGTPVPSATASQTPLPVAVELFFASGQPSADSTLPSNQAVAREVAGSGSPIDGALAEYFKGPSADEQGRGLVGVYNGFTGYRRAELLNGILGVYLEGNCQPNGTSYTIAQPLIATLRQFPAVLTVKIYDEYDHTRDPLGSGDSWPVCLESIFTSTWTPKPTMTSSATPSAVPTVTTIPTATATVAATSTPVPSSTPTPTPVPSSTATPMPLPSSTATPMPLPSSTATPMPLPSSTATPTPVPSSTATVTPIPSPTRSPIVAPTASATEMPRATIMPTVAAGTPASTEKPRAPVPSILESILMFFRQLFGGQ